MPSMTLVMDGGKERREKERKEKKRKGKKGKKKGKGKEGREETVRSSSDLRNYNGRNSSDQEAKFVFAPKAMRRYKKKEASPKL